MQRIGKYHVQRVLGRGGMGTVYEALDPLINRKVAIKTMIPGLVESPDLRARFMREAQAGGRLRHRNIVTVYDLGEDKGQPYIAMEFVEGTDLEKIIQNRQPLTMEQKLEIVHQMCDGLAYAHRNGVVHRDVKPANIRVTPDGEVKIMDFGIAHLQSSSMTKSGLVLGTVHYMAPEQLDGHKVDHRADIFSVGAIAYELIAGRRPFEADSITGIMFKIMHDQVDRGRLPTTGYSPGLETIVLKALARDLRERYDSLDAMRDDLDHLMRAHAPAVDPVQVRLDEARTARGAGQVQRALRAAQEALRLAPSSLEAQALVVELEKEDRRSHADHVVEEGEARLAASETGKALEYANQALAIVPGHTRALALARQAETDSLRERVEREVQGIRRAMEQARADGQLQRALSLGRRLLEVEPDEPTYLAALREIEATIHDREVEQLCGAALSYVAGGDLALAERILARIEKIAPAHPKCLELKSYLAEEKVRHAAATFVQSAKEHLALGNLEEALAAVKQALVACPDLAEAQEIQAAVAKILGTRSPARDAVDGHAAAAPQSAAAPERDAALVSAQPPAVFAGAPIADASSGAASVVGTDSAPPVDPVEPPRVVVTAPAAPPPAAPPPDPALTPAPARAERGGTNVVWVAAPSGEAGAVSDVAATHPAPPPNVDPVPPTLLVTPPPHAAEPSPAPPSLAPPASPLPPRSTAPAPPPTPGASATALLSSLTARPGPPRPAAGEPLTPLPEGPVADPHAEALLQQARRALRTREPRRALPLLEQAAQLAPEHAGVQRLLATTQQEVRSADVEELTNQALDLFVRNSHGPARRAVSSALALDPSNKKARELEKILSVLG